MSYSYILKLNPGQIEGFDFFQAEEKAVYIRYLLNREQREDIILEYYYYLELIEEKLKQLRTTPDLLPNHIQKEVAGRI